MKKIVLIPLDERPCNARFPTMMPGGRYHTVVPPLSLLGKKKAPADVGALERWLRAQAEDADYLILSLDMMLYGGIVPSRLHRLSEEEIDAKMSFLEGLKKRNSHLRIYAFQLIMRCPSYSSSDEEPDYYEQWGAQIHLLGKYEHLLQLGKLSKEEKGDRLRLLSEIPQEALSDFLGRRKKNLAALMRSLEYVKSGAIDFFVVPQDDAAVYGYTSMDQMTVRRYIKENFLHRKIMMYPSADDTGMTLLARAVNDLYGKRPKIFVRYASAKGAFVIPSFEDRMIDETLNYQIMASGGVRTDSAEECDIYFAVNIGSGMYPENPDIVTCYDIERNLAMFLENIEDALGQGKTVALADVARANGGDCELIGLLSASGLLLRIHAYAGWNTSSNTIGTVICQSALLWQGGDVPANRKFLLHRYVEDVAYCSHTRAYVTEHCLPALGLNYFHADGQNGRAAECVREELLRYLQNFLPEVYEEIEDLSVTLPWERMFEADIRLQCRNEQNG